MTRFHRTTRLLKGEAWDLAPFVDIDGAETGAGKCGGHFGLTIHALFAEDGDSGARAFFPARSGAGGRQ